MNSKLKEAFRFCLVGGFATLLHYGLYWVLMQYINVNIAYAAGYILSFIANFYLTAYFTFRVAPSFKKAVGMGGAHLVNFLLHMGLLNLFLVMGIPEKWAPIPVFAIAIPVNFLLVRFVFKKRDR
ncbi:MAG: GtrA family protein [Bacteroidales bacterium]|nr:GtrA family protein [Bacteroidales bacterium]